MRVFDYPGDGFKCPICGTGDDKPVVLIGISGTEDGNICEAEQFHLDCIELTYFKPKNGQPSLLAQTWEV